jgi:hypothetical protein
MRRERRYLELLALLGLVGVVAFILNIAIMASGQATGISVVIQLLSTVAMVLGGAAWLGLLVADRVSVRQERILQQLDEIKAAQNELKSGQAEGAVTALTDAPSPDLR